MQAALAQARPLAAETCVLRTASTPRPHVVGVASSTRRQSGANSLPRSGSAPATPHSPRSQRSRRGQGASAAGHDTPPLSSAASSRGDTDRGSFQISANGGRSPRAASGASHLPPPLSKACSAAVAYSDGLSARALESSGKALGRPESLGPMVSASQKEELRVGPPGPAEGHAATRSIDRPVSLRTGSRGSEREHVGGRRRLWCFGV